MEYEKIKMKNLLSAKDLSKEEILEIFGLTDKLKNKKNVILENKVLAMIFEKPSTRTRVSFETAIHHLGGHAIYLSKNDIQLGRGETIEDTARVLSRYVDGITARLFSHKDLLKLAKFSSIPVINALTDLEHPCQALADLYTIKERKGLKKLRIAFFGDGANNTFHSLIYLCEKFNFEIVVSCPNMYSPKIHANFRLINDPKTAAKGADVIYTDTFVSMGKRKKQNRD
jgi:ornithine carbamoyltransferase